MFKDIIKEKINEQLSYLREKYHIKNIGIFGSVARNEETENSDIDILVEIEKPIGFFDFIRLENFLSNLLQKS